MDNNNEKEVERIIGYTFKNTELLKRALTLSGYNNISKGAHGNYQRLEYLGDALLDFIIAEELFKKYPKFDEGMLTKQRSQIVSKTPLAEVVDKHNLINYVYRDKGVVEISEKLRSDIFESLLAGIYLDSNSLDEAKNFVLYFLKDKIEEGGAGEVLDYKSLLYEEASLKKWQVNFELDSTDGPPHNQVFTMTLFVDDKKIATGFGTTKRKAEQECSKLACLELNIIKE